MSATAPSNTANPQQGIGYWETSGNSRRDAIEKKAFFAYVTDFLLNKARVDRLYDCPVDSTKCEQELGETSLVWSQHWTGHRHAFNHCLVKVNTKRWPQDKKGEYGHSEFGFITNIDDCEAKQQLVWNIMYGAVEGITIEGISPHHLEELCVKCKVNKNTYNEKFGVDRNAAQLWNWIRSASKWQARPGEEPAVRVRFEKDGIRGEDAIWLNRRFFLRSGWEEIGVQVAFTDPAGHDATIDYVKKFVEAPEQQPLATWEKPGKFTH